MYVCVCVCARARVCVCVYVCVCACVYDMWVCVGVEGEKTVGRTFFFLKKFIV